MPCAFGIDPEFCRPEMYGKADISTTEPEWLFLIYDSFEDVLQFFQTIFV